MLRAMQSKGCAVFRPAGLNILSRFNRVVYWMGGRIGWQAMACHPTDLPAAQCTTPLHLEQQYRQASWKGGSPCTAITGNHAPSSKRGCMKCLGIFQSSASLSTIKKHCYAPLPLNASYKSIYDSELSKFIGPLYAVYKSVSSIGVGLYATLTPTDASHSSGQTLNTLRVCIHIP